MNTKIIIKKFLFFIIMLLLIVIMLFCLLKINNWLKDSKMTKVNIENIQKKVNIKSSDNNSIIIKQSVRKDDPYWKLIKLPFMDINITNLKKINKDTIGWLKIKKTNINYPVVQTTNNKYYLKHSFDKSKNSAGWVFMDYRNNYTDIDQNNIIYANGKLDQTMFGSLRNVLKKSWFNDQDNYIINFSTEKYNSMWQIFSIYKTIETNNYLSITFNNKELNNIQKKSIYDFKTNVDISNKILTLSTYFYDNNRLVIHAKLIKIENK